MSQCPTCKRRLRQDAIRCLCGWSAASMAQAPRKIECAHIGCPNGAIVRVGKANLCRAHYDAHWTPENIKAHYVVKPSTAHMEEVRAAYLKSYACRHRDDYAIVPKKLEREPGQDDEERIAA